MHDSVGTLLEPYGEFLSVNCAGNSYWLLHTIHKTDMNAVNLKNSERTIDDDDFIDLKKC